MRKIPLIFFIVFVVTSCSSTQELVDYNLFKNELNSAIQDGFPEANYTVK